MTVPDQTPQNVHTANGATTTFAYQFKILDTDHLEVYLDDVLQTSGYSVTGEGVNAGGTVVFTTAPAADTEVILMRSMTIERTAYDYQNAGDFLAATVNEDFDAAIMIAQQINNKVDQRALLFPKTLDRTNNTNALPEPQDGRVLYWSNGEIQNALISALTTNPTFASELRTFDTMAQAIADATLEETNILLVKGLANSLWDLSSSGTADGYRVRSLTASGLYATLRIDGINTAYKMGVVLDGDKAGGGTDNAGAMQAFLNYVRDNGGSHVHTLPGCIRSDTQLTLLSNVTTRRAYLVDFGGVFIDFTSCAATSGDFLAWGATSQANAHDDELDVVKNFILIGNETSVTSTPATTCVGLSLEYALRCRAENILVQNCYEGFKTNFVFDFQNDNLCAKNCVIGLRIDDDSTYAQWNNFQAVNCVYGRVIKPGTSGKIVANQTFINPRFEGNDVGSAIDGGTNASFGVRGIVDINSYAESNTYDLYREGLQWTLANPATRNAASVGYVVNTRIHGGDWSGMTWSGTCAAIVWPSSIGTVLGGEYRIPAAITNCVNYPGKYTYQQLLDLTSGLGQNINPTSMPGYGVCVIRGSDGATTISNNLISSTARTGTGVYTITLRETMTGSTDIAVAASCDGGYVELDTASSTTTLLTLKAFSNAGVAIDPARVRVMIHGVLT